MDVGMSNSAPIDSRAAAEASRGDETRQASRLIEAAQEVYSRAYAPYSSYRVAAAVLANDGKIYTGCNIENAVYPLTMCAERVAIFNAIAAGARVIEAIAVVTSNAGTPCGSCRQVMREFAADATPIHVADLTGAYQTYTLDELLPVSFSAKDLSGARTDSRSS
jgi:cytidine deaminase